MNHRLRRSVTITLLTCLLCALSVIAIITPAHAEEWTPQHFSFELKPGFFFPTGNNFETFFGDCCNMFYVVEFGRLFQSRYDVGVGVGFFTRDGNAIDEDTGEASGERFNLTLIPLNLHFNYRADFKEDQLLVPYVGVGVDYVVARENFQSAVTNFSKIGLDGRFGIQILTEGLGDAEDNLEGDAGINDTYFIIEGKYSYIDDFGGNGLDLSGWTISLGFLLEF